MANPQRSLDKWVRNTGAAAQAYKDGVADVQESPGVKANASKDKYIRNVQEAFNSGRYEAGNNSYSLQDWKDAATKKGAANYQNGVTNISARAKQNIVAALNQGNAIKAECSSMPNNSDADALAKVARAMQLWKAFKAGRTR